jgi:dienelactone hydrolase
MGTMIRLQRPDGSDCQGYFADAGPNRPAVIVIQEWWELNPQICGIADRFADAGFTAVAPDLFHGRITQDPDEANHLMNGLEWQRPPASMVFRHGSLPILHRSASRFKSTLPNTTTGARRRL